MTIQIIAALLSLGLSSIPQSSWPLWTSYANHFIQEDGRVVDPDRDDLTTSEGQSYAMFFALVANDRARFDHLFLWTVNNLAGGTIETTLPAWSWGKKTDGSWGIKDTNSASDSDLWIAYDLIQAGRLWKSPVYANTGMGLLKLIAEKEVSHVHSFPILLPAQTGFEHDGMTVMNPSYMPLFLLQSAATVQPEGPWGAMAASLPSLVRGGTAAGFAPDWIKIEPDGTMSSTPPLDLSTEQATGSYDAIRVYLWAGLTSSNTHGRDDLLKALSGMTSYMRTHPLPPEFVIEDKPEVRGDGPISFSAALIPFLQESRAPEAVAQQKKRLKDALSTGTGLYGQPPRYYDQNLAMFALGYTEHRFHIQSNGELEVPWQR
ncbi:cellulose synthase complex periplasmic endoglucanase BcsZ [Granulicella mallensis]|uniref:cellulase n=1 Tax=Granulicella mallensis (strain ATCC BAA-1857 / DSM 23137 / MP5ACTX8) TaxID=682795 RepID=G8NVC7_GRAMM|nr:cellulose synthase complex periplasmic endoglucanase BcsZ [Granulicella mallensis]AEU36508.1 Cellulase [Granulicella mallensis MP5ACTX8]